MTWARTLLGTAGGLAVIYAAWPYIRQIRARDPAARPRLVSWLIWAQTTAVAAAWELAAGQPSAAALGAGCALSCVAVLAAGWRFGSGHRPGQGPWGWLDWPCLAGAETGVILLAAGAVPGWAGVALAVATDLAAYLPTYVNGWRGQEPATPYAWNTAGSALAAAAVTSATGLILAGYLTAANAAMTLIARLRHPAQPPRYPDPMEPAAHDIHALLLTVPGAGLYEPDPGPAWLRWDDTHWVGPLGTPPPGFGTVEQIPVNTLALHHD